MSDQDKSVEDKLVRLKEFKAEAKVKAESNIITAAEEEKLAEAFRYLNLLKHRGS